jgi:hypothetical protein
VPIIIEKPTGISKLAVEVTAVGSAATALLGLYDVDANNLPRNLLTSASPSALDLTSTGVKETTLSSTIPVKPGLYFAAYLAVHSSAPTMRCISADQFYAPTFLGATSATNALGTTRIQGYRQANATGSLLAAASTSFGTTLLEHGGAVVNVAWMAA